MYNFVKHLLFIDLNVVFKSPAHGTYIGTMRIESEKPTQLPVDSTFHFGASTRYYILRERPQNAPRPILEELEEEAKSGHQDGGKLGLPESEMELDVRAILNSTFYENFTNVCFI